MDRKKLIKLIREHLRRTKESSYAFGTRVMRDKAYFWKLKNHDRKPRPSTVARIRRAIRLREAKLVGAKSGK